MCIDMGANREKSGSFSFYRNNNKDGLTLNNALLLVVRSAFYFCQHSDWVRPFGRGTYTKLFIFRQGHIIIFAYHCSLRRR